MHGPSSKVLVTSPHGKLFSFKGSASFHFLDYAGLGVS
jgi:hypothetical protein